MTTTPGPHSQSPTIQKLHDPNTERYRTRLLARLCLVLITIVQLIVRMILVFTESGFTKDSKNSYLTSFPFIFAIWVVVGIEYALFRKLGSGVMKYSKIVDFCLLLVYNAEWVTILNTSFKTFKDGDPPTVAQTAILTFTTFGFRTLMQVFVVQNWKLRVIAPTVAVGMVMGYEISFIPHQAFYILLRGIVQVIIVVILFYFEDKMNWRMMLTNLQQEKWMQINDFILNNIPENIMILDIDGETRFISDYCKSFFAKCQLPLDPQALFKQVKCLQQLRSESETIGNPPHPQTTERCTTFEDNLESTRRLKKQNSIDLSNIPILQDLLLNFKNTIKDRNLQEKQFLIYNGKLITDDDQQEKSIEIKISFIEQLEKPFIILIIRDTTQRDLLIALEDNNRYKDQLLASVSHELRAPLNGNINLVETAIQSKMIPSDLKENLLVPALRSSKFLLHLINDILDMSQIKAQKLRLIFQSGNLRESLNDTIKLVELQARKKGLELDLDLDAGLPSNFCTDHLRLSQIVLNILNNAIKFTQKGGVKITARTMKEENSWVKITVEDSGIGMDQESLQKLFTLFTHIEFEGRKSMNPNGVGLGLNIAANLVGFLGPKEQNRITVQSVPKQGSIFSFIIENKDDNGEPLKKEGLDKLESSESELAVPNEVRKEVEQKPLVRLQTLFSSKSLIPVEKPRKHSLFSECLCAKVLIVDDNPFNTMAFESILGSLTLPMVKCHCCDIFGFSNQCKSEIFRCRKGYCDEKGLKLKCDSVYNGQAGIEKIMNRENKVCGTNCKPYKVIFMDQEMPEMTGIETVKEIKRLEGEGKIGGGLKIIGCTAHGSKEEVERFLASGINLCIHKPISTSLIQKVLASCEVSI